jgi:hypothetical protein
MGGMWLLGCAMKPAAAQAPASEPPPRGAPGARQGNLPPPSPMHESELDDSNRRFPINEAQQRKEQQQRARVPAAARVEVRGSDGNRACDGLTAEEKTECPLHDRKAVVSISDLPRGARVTLRPGTSTPQRLQQLFACHKSLAAARPQSPGACPFFDARSDAEVSVRGGRIDVDIERHQDVDALRQQVRTALGPAR